LVAVPLLAASRGMHPGTVSDHATADRSGDEPNAHGGPPLRPKCLERAVKVGPAAHIEKPRRSGAFP